MADSPLTRQSRIPCSRVLERRRDGLLLLREGMRVAHHFSALPSHEPSPWIEISAHTDEIRVFLNNLADLVATPPKP